MIWLNTIIVTVIAFFLQLGSPEVTKMLSLTPALLAAQPWSIVTSMFMHADFLHLVFNMWAIVLFGGILEPKIGRRNFLALYLGTGVLANIAFILFYPAGTMGLGASGAVFGIIGALIILQPNLPLYFFFVPMPLWFAGVIWAIIDMLGMLAPASGVANVAHLAGLAAGLAAGYLLKRQGHGGRLSEHAKDEDEAIKYSKSKGYY